MTTRAVEQFDEWGSSPFSDGYRGLQTLADRDFSGIIESGTAKLCMLNGTAVGILDGDIDDFEDASGTAYESPSPALPLLTLMQERNDEVRAKYYTEDTPVEDVDGTLADGGFTGFIELSENVLSGDYYVVYHQGRSMAVAWVGNTGQLLTDDEAFDRVNGEVGIFEVRPAELDPVEIPESDSGTAGAAGGDTSEAGDAGASAAGAGAADAVADDGGNASADTDDAAVDDDGGDQFADDVAGASDGAASATEPDPSDVAVASDAGQSSSAGETTASADDTTVGEGAGTETTETKSVSETEARADADAGSSGEESRTDAGRSGGETVTDERAGEEMPDETARDSDEAARDRTDRSRTASKNDSARDTEREESTDARGRERDSANRSTESRSDSQRDRTSDTDPDRTDRTDRDRTDRDRTDRADSRDSSRETDARAADTTRETGRERSGSTADQSGRTAEASGRSETAGRSGAGEAGTPGRSADSGAANRTGETGGARAGAGGAADQLATHTIPSLDPSRTTAASGDGDASVSPEEPPAPEPTDSTVAPAAEERTEPPARTDPEPAGARERERVEGQDQPATDASESRADRSGASSRSAESTGADSSARVDELEAELAERDAAIQELEADLSAAESDREDLRTQLEDVRTERDDLRAQIDDLEAERDQLASERDSLESEVGDLEAEVEHFESQIDEIEAEFGAAVDADRRMSPGEALEQTNLFVRYESKGKATLETAHAGESTREEVAKNLGLEYHTQFEQENVSVGGRPFDEFLRETIQWQFVNWVINDLLYEIRETGKTSALEDLYNAIPQIDRAELNGVVATEYTEDGQERRSQESFDVVMRDRLGNALLTANMNDSRQAATESMMSSLVTASSHVGESTDTLGASLLVTSSFFEPEALETAANATSGGLLSRDKRESYVKISRKQGYHLCLVEAREDKFHLAVPEL